ncbi:hypothetical protein HanXRQr2_Chr04g0165391 [Helianthus annuus]|uniref:Uncharacterized protein n=1 Tax=Helianthus annuus TaxID=4232 RepID=A0A9K3NR82_HELAN|nr:hypothetical protein HanXRQr2_Chr04g0165391 [Helianthus annuus]KAJ0931224.1 hypothetical protein HanPSC8_Chr04g0159131 [Helianthus annuus]
MTFGQSSFVVLLQPRALFQASLHQGLVSLVFLLCFLTRVIFLLLPHLLFGSRF